MHWLWKGHQVPPTLVFDQARKLPRSLPRQRGAENGSANRSLEEGGCVLKFRRDNMPKLYTLLILALILLATVLSCATAHDPTAEDPVIGCIITTSPQGDRFFERVSVEGEDEYGKWIVRFPDRKNQSPLHIEKELVSFQCHYWDGWDIERRAVH